MAGGVYQGEGCHYIFLLTSPCFDRLLAGLKSRRKCANLGLNGSVIDGLLAGLKSRRKFSNIGLKGSLWFISMLKKSQKMYQIWPTGISY